MYFTAQALFEGTLSSSIVRGIEHRMHMWRRGHQCVYSHLTKKEGLNKLLYVVLDMDTLVHAQEKAAQQAEHICGSQKFQNKYRMGDRNIIPTSELHPLELTSLVVLCVELREFSEFQASALADICTLRHAITAAGAVEALVRGRPDLIVIISDTPEAEARELARTLRDMQSTALEQLSPILLARNDVENLHARLGDCMRDGHADSDFDEQTSRLDLHDAVLRFLTQIKVTATKPQGAIWIERGIVEGLPEYLASRRDLADAVFSMLSSDDRVGAARAAHKMIGSPGIHGFDEGVSFYRTIEALAEFPELSISDAMLRTARDLADAFASPDVR